MAQPSAHEAARLMEYLAADGITHGLDMATSAKREFFEKFDAVILQPRNLEYKVQFTPILSLSLPPRVRRHHRRFIVAILIKAVDFMIEIADKQIHPAILIQIRRIDSHSRTNLAALAERNSSGKSNFLKFLSRAIHEEKISRIVGHEQIRVSVVIEIGGHHAPRFARVA